MTTGLYILAAFAIAVLAGSAFLIAYLVMAVHFDKRAEDKRRAEQGREVTPEWLAVLAATDTPIFAEVWAESLRRDLEEWSA